MTFDQEAHDVEVLRRAGEQTVAIVEDMFLSAKFAGELSPDPEGVPSANWLLEYVLEAMHGGDYTDDPDAYAAGDYSFLMTVEAIRLAADFLLHRHGGDHAAAAEHVARLRKLAFP